MEVKLAPVVTLEYLSRNRENIGKEKIILVGGGFDIIHAGHIEHLQEAKSLGGTVVVHITGDNRIRDKKGPLRPVFSASDRAKIVSAIRFVDYVFIFEGRHYDQKILDELQPDIIFLNSESSRDFLQKKGKQLKLRSEFFISSKQKINSTSEVIRKIKENSFFPL